MKISRSSICGGGVSTTLPRYLIHGRPVTRRDTSALVCTHPRMQRPFYNNHHLPSYPRLCHAVAKLVVVMRIAAAAAPPARKNIGVKMYGSPHTICRYLYLFNDDPIYRRLFLFCLFFCGMWLSFAPGPPFYLIRLVKHHQSPRLTSLPSVRIFLSG